MRAKKAKALKRLAREFVIQNPNAPKNIDWYKRLKLNYKATKGEI
jgi:hypothetical protein